MPRDIVDLVAQYSRKRSTPTSYENLALLQSPSQRQRLLGARMANQQYTGSGPDGIVQTDRPVEMVNTTRGPRMIHEGEVKQQNRDGSTTVIPNNRISAQQQQRLMTLEQQGNVPGYKTGGRYTPSYGGTGSGSGGLVNPGKGYTPGGAGGVPYNPRHTPGATGGGTGGGGLVNLGKGHTPGGAGGVPYNPYLDGAGGYTPPNHTPGTIRTPGATGGGTGDGGGWDPVTLRPRSSRDYREKNRTNAGGVTDPLVIAKGNDLWHNKSRFDSVPSASGIPDTGAEQVTVDGPALTLTPVSTGPVIETPPPGTPDPVSSGMDEGYGIVRDVARGQSDASRRARDYYGESINMAGASEDARILQQLIAQGYSPQEAQAYLLTRRRDRDVAKGQMFGQMGIAEAERAEQAGRDLVTLGIQRGRYDLERQKYGDAETQRMAADIAAGLSYQQMVEKYPNLSRSDYENMSDTILYEQNQQRRTDSFNSTAGYVDQQIATNPDYVSSGAWKTDEMMLNFLGEQWKAFGGNGEFDLSNPVHSAWAEAQVESMAMSDLEVAISQYRSQDWYKELDDDEREDVDALFAVLPKLEATQGYQLNENPDGSTYITGPDGTVAYGSKQGGAGGFSSQDVDAVVDWVALNVGQTVEPGRAAEWLRQNGGVMPESAAEWNSWNSSVPTESNLHEFFSGTGGVELTAADRDALPRVLEAVNAVNEGSATAEQEALAAQYPEISSYKTIKSSFKGSFSGNVDDNKTEGLGNIKVFGSYNPDVYSTSWIYNGDRRQAWRNRDGVNFNFTQKFIDSVTGENAGAIINNNGQYYQVATDNPFVTKAFKADFTEGDDTWDMTYNVQGLRVLNLATGQEEVLYFDHKVDWSDT